MNKYFLVVGILFSNVAYCQSEKQNIQNDLISMFKVQEVEKQYITNLLGVPKDTLKETFYHDIPSYPELGLSFFSGHINVYTTIIIDINKVKNGFSSEDLNFKPNMSLYEFIKANKGSGKFDFVKKDITHKQYYNRVIIHYNDFELISEPLTDEQFFNIEKTINVSKDNLKVNEAFLKKVKCELIWGNFFEGPPGLN